MDRWLEALAALGGFAAIGGLIDLAMYKSEKAKLKAKLEDWWLRFDDISWSNFGRAEAEVAIQILDRLAGPRLWSWRRWAFSIATTVAVLAIISIWNLVRTDWHHRVLLNSTVLGVMVGPWTLSLALSLSLTRYIAVLAAKASTNALYGSAAFGLLLVVHFLLITYWSIAVFYFVMLPITFLLNGFELEHHLAFASDVYRLTTPVLWRGWLPLPDWSDLFRWKIGAMNLGEAETLILLTSKTGMDIVGNGIRIVFALVFLSSFVFRPLVQEPISRLWYGAMNSKKPVFTILFGSVGMIVAVVRALSQSDTPLLGI